MLGTVMDDRDGEHMPSLAEVRVLLRPWREADLTDLVRLNADPLVMKYFPSTLSAEDSARFMARNAEHIQAYGYGLWVLELPGVAEFAGFVGLLRVGFEAAFTPAVEIGWRLLPAFWGQGYVTEAARLALRFGFEDLGLDEIVSFTVPANRRSRAVMERLGFSHAANDDFLHPRLPAGHPLHRHMLYRLPRDSWLRGL